MKSKMIVTSAVFASAFLFSQAPTNAGDLESGAVYTMDNASAANHLLVYNRAADGTLSAGTAVATGGLGTGAGLGSQGAVALSANGHWLFVCNAGSDEISVFNVTEQGPTLTDKIWSGGRHPISLALHNNLLFVLNAGGQSGDKDSITGFVFSGAKLTALANSQHSLSDDNTNPAQIGFSGDGNVLVVTEKDTSTIDTFTLDNDGAVTDAKNFQSAGQTPFGFDIRGSTLVVSEAFGGATDASAASSYDIAQDGELTLISASVPTTESSACWAMITGNGRFAYTANTGSGTVTGFHVSHENELTRLNDDGVTGVTGAKSSPADMALSGGSRYLYVRNGNSTVSAFRVNADGSLQSIGITQTPSGTVGIVAR
jgi:6-phosphogluconolactonase (cycloisomerase 2 family)